MGFKEDADFARFVSMGAVATDAVRRHLNDVHGHRVAELERYAMANKVWQTKVKRLRLPDLLCVRCGRRIESRGKSQLGIVLSHSDAQGRGWDDGGMRDNDLYAFLRVDLTPPEPHTSEPVYFRTVDLRAVVDHTKESDRKATSEGSEVTLTWKTWVPSRSGRVVEIDAEDRILCEWDSGNTYRYYQWKTWPTRHLYVQPGEAFVAAETMVAGIAPNDDAPICAGDIWDPADELTNADPADRYTAVRGAGLLGRDDLSDILESVAGDDAEDWRIRLEATASLARFDPDRWTDSLAAIALDPESDLEHRMESVFILSEIPTDSAARALNRIAGTDEPETSELRSAAVWGMCQGVVPASETALPFAVDTDDLVALHTIAGIPELPDSVIPRLLEWLEEPDVRKAATAAHLLMRHQAVRALLQAATRGGSARLWALRALGDLPPELIRDVGGDLLTDDIEEALDPLWVGQSDWLRSGTGAEGIDALDVQRVRFDPRM